MGKVILKAANTAIDWLFGSGYEGSWLQQHVFDVDTGLGFCFLCGMLVWIVACCFSKKLRSKFF